MANLFNHAYPYLDEHELNLDWLIAKMKELNIAFDEFKVVNHITFSGQWDITKQYPAWTIVSDNNIGYVSIQPVPVGVVLTNTDYWVEVIDYTAQIAGLQSRVIVLENRADGFDTDISNINDDLATLLMSERKFLFVGDSYATTSPNWVDICVNACGIVNYDNLGAAGAAFFDNKFINQITNYTGTRDDVTDIVVGGGLNDARFTSGNADYNTCKQAIIDFADYAKLNYPKARLWLAFIGNALDNAPLLSGRTWDKRIWAKWCYENVGRENGFTIIDGSDMALALSKYNFSSDYLHPNTSGSTVIGNNIANILSGGSIITTYPTFLVGVTAVTGMTISANNIEYIASNGEFTLTMPASVIATIGGLYPTFNGNAKLDLMIMDNLYFNKKVIKDCDIRLDNFNSRSYTHLHAQLIFEGDTISIQLNEINSAGTGFETYTANNATSSLVINNGFTVSVPYQFIN